jgi:hypothetical protein
VLLDEFGCNNRIDSRLLAGHRRDHTNRCGVCLNGSIFARKGEYRHDAPSPRQEKASTEGN